jgi:hypothetical protein
MAITKTPAETIKQLQAVNGEYFRYLIEACLEKLKGFYFDPQSSSLVPRFYQALGEQYLTDECYKKLDANNIKYIADCKHSIAHATGEYLRNLLSKCLVNLKDSEFLLQDETKNWDLKLLNHYGYVYSEFGDDNLSTLVTKLKVVANLQYIITLSQPEHPVQERLSEEGTLKRFKMVLVSNKKVLQMKRHPFEDRVLNVMSILLFPIGIWRAIDSRIYHGTWNFMQSKGGLVANQMTQEIKKQLTVSCKKM